MNNYNLIEDYLAGKLDGQILNDFKDKMSSDPSFASEVAEHQGVQEMIHLKGLLETKEKLNNIRKAKLAEQAQWTRMKWFLGGGLAITGLVIGLFINSPQTPENNLAVKPKNQLNASVDYPLSAPGNINLSSDSVNSIPLTQNQNEKSIIGNVAKDTSKTASCVTQNPGDLPQILSVPPTQNSTQMVSKEPQEDKGTVGPAPAPAGCAGVIMRAQINTEESCSDSPTGKLYLSGITGGNGTYTYSLKNASYAGSLATTSSINYFNDIAPGTYVVSIIDGNSCITEVQAIVGEKICDPNKKNIFAPEYNETWSYPIKAGINCTIRIYSSSGALVYQEKIQNGYPMSWDGKDDDGTPLRAAAYIYQIQYEDGTISNGSVTIAR